MSNDSFDLDELDSLTSQSTVTAWSSHVAPKGRARRTYGRRGSTGVLPTVATAFSRTIHPQEPLDLLSPTQEENEFDEFSPVPAFKLGAPTIPGRRRFTRANSLSGISNSTSTRSSQPSLRRCVSTSTNSLGSSSMHSRRSSSLSSNIEDSISELGSENVHPNVNPLEGFASPKRGSALKDSRGRKKVRSEKNLNILDSPSLPPIPPLPESSSFSNLARTDSGSWGNAPQPSDASPFPSRPRSWTELDISIGSPALSMASARKRGVCESPFEDFDDVLVSGPFSSARRTIARSGLLSPALERSGSLNLDSSERSAGFSQHSASKAKKYDTMDIASDDGDSGEEIMDSSDDLSIENKRMRRSPVPTFVPFHQRQKKYPSTATSNDARTKGAARTTGRPEDVIESMTSYHDLKFLAKKLKAERDVSHINLCVPLPVEWQSQRRADVIRWGTNHLGFKLFSGGAQMVYLQISKSKGVTLLKLLEESIAECKEQGLARKTPKHPKASIKNLFNLKTPSNVSFVGGAAASKTPKELTFNSPRFGTPEILGTLDDDLMQGMQALGMKDREHLPREFPLQASIILEDDEESSLHDPRPSVENHSNAHDLMSHMGMTPARQSRPSRLSLGSVATAGTASKYTAASPFPQPSLASAKSSHCKTFEFLETPMAKPLDLGWGSNPVEGRDWGKSEQCEECVLDTLLQKLKQAQVEAGCQLEEDTDGPRPTALGLDLEAASGYRDNSSSPESTSNNEDFGSSRDFFLDGMDESSPSSIGASDHMDVVAETKSNHAPYDSRALRRRQTSFAKHKRMSLFASAVNPAAMFNARKSLFVRPPRPSAFPMRASLLKSTLVSEHTFAASAELAPTVMDPTVDTDCTSWLENDTILKRVLVYLSEPELLRSASLVCTGWADIATEAHAELMLLSVGCKGFLHGETDGDDDDSDDESSDAGDGVQGLLDRPWDYLTSTFPWARFLAEGGFKQVYKVFNHNHRVEEAISVMDINMLKDAGEMNVVGAELAVSVMLSSLVRRGICPNFVVTRGAFSCTHKPPASIWGSEKNKCPKGETYSSPKTKRRPKKPKATGRYQYIRMELCDGGDAEEFLKTVPDEMLSVEESRQLLFQMSFALHAAANRCSLKHYDVKLLNYFLQHVKSEKDGDIVLRYGLGEHVFSLRSSSQSAIMAKLADYGTANVDAATNGQQVTIAQFTTLENTPIDFMILGDRACQGHGHDNFGLGLCMLHLFTGHAPYEEILEDVTCPKNLKGRLRDVWECEDEEDFSVIRSVILSDVDKDEEGHIIEGEPNEVLYDTFYRFLVLFGLPDVPPKMAHTKVWHAVRDCLEGVSKCRKGKKRPANDTSRYTRDCRKYSITHGSNKYIARARERLLELDGGLDLLLSLVGFDPATRYTAMDVMNSGFMEPLRETHAGVDQYSQNDDVRTFTSFSTQY